jgi:lysophospholipase L1-like esterase
LLVLVEAIRFRQPQANILLSGLLPRRGMEERMVVLNKRIAGLATANHIQYINPGLSLLNTAQKIDESLFSDGLHPNEKGYWKLGERLKTTIGNVK